MMSYEGSGYDNAPAKRELDRIRARLEYGDRLGNAIADSKEALNKWKEKSDD